MPAGSQDLRAFLRTLLGGNFVTRLYEPAWQKLKRDKKIVIAAAPQVHARILKAVIKEKDSDVLYKLSCDDDGKRARITSKSAMNAITITLKLLPGNIYKSDF